MYEFTNTWNLMKMIQNNIHKTEKKKTLKDVKTKLMVSKAEIWGRSKLVVCD